MRTKFDSYVFILANPEDDIENVSVGGMDVSDIEDDDRGPMTTRRSETSGPMSTRRSDTSGPMHHPRPPPRTSRNQQKSYAQPLVMYSYLLSTLVYNLRQSN